MGIEPQYLTFKNKDIFEHENVFLSNCSYKKKSVSFFCRKEILIIFFYEMHSSIQDPYS